MVTRRRAFALLIAVTSCSTASVQYAGGPGGSATQDSDDGSVAAAGDDGAVNDDGGVGPGPTPEAGSDASATCNCGSGNACCIPANAPPFCYPADDASTCAAAGGLAFACVTGENGRECCMAPDRRSSFPIGFCDAGVQLCGDPNECHAGTCMNVTCRTAQIAMCVSGTPPTCPP
jgi:hypothetical protein